MGLDMYLYKKHFVKNFEGTPNDKRFDVKVKKGRDIVQEINPKRISEIVEEIGYWRKANAIHNWFVQNVQGGTDDCKEYYVSFEKMIELYETVEKVLAGSKLIAGKVHNGTRYSNGSVEEIYEDGKIVEDSTLAEELLPTTDGFFFGGTEYNEYYIHDLKHTIDILKPEIEQGETNASYYYQSSW